MSGVLPVRLQDELHGGKPDLRKVKTKEKRGCPNGISFSLYFGRENYFMKENIHKFEQGGEYILLDVNSGAVHLIDK